MLRAAPTTEDPLEVEVTGASAPDHRRHAPLQLGAPSTQGCYQLVIGLSDRGTLRADFNLR